MAEVIIVRNRGESDFHGAFNSRPFVIPADGEMIIETEAAKKCFGNWEERNVGREERHQFRTAELARLKAIYGAHFDDRPDDPRTPEPLTADQKWEVNRPRVELFNQDGTRIIGVLDDPTGTSLPLEDAPSGVLAQAVETMRQQIEDLRSQVMRAEEIQATTDIPTDGPDSSPQRRRGAVKVDANLEADVG